MRHSDYGYTINGTLGPILQFRRGDADPKPLPRNKNVNSTSFSTNFARVVALFENFATRVPGWHDYTTVMRNADTLLLSTSGPVTTTSLSVALGTRFLLELTQQNSCWSEYQALPRDDPMIAVLVSVFSIIASDTEQVIRIMRTSLRQIDRGTMDDGLLQENLQIWRRFITDIREVLPTTLESLHTVSHFLDHWEGSDSTYLTQRLKSLERDVGDTISLAINTQQTLSTNISIIDSKKGIAEAEAVTRLTELAVSTLFN